jgi:N-methylhydantoinase B
MSTPNLTSMSLRGAGLAVLASRFDGIARQMAHTLLRTGRSGVLNRARDFSCCIVTATGDLLTAAESLPIHVLSGPDMMARTMVKFHDALARGDAFLHNSPYHGCSHAADHTILVPVIDDEGRHRYTVLAKAHQADIGNSIPTTYYGEARDIYQEGALIFPAVQVQRGYRDIEDIIRMCEIRIRVPEQWRGDYLAAMGAARIGERQLLALGAELGWDRLDEFAGAWFDYSERCMVDAIRKLPTGSASGTATHDPFPGTPIEGVVITSKVSVNAELAHIEVDLRDNCDCLPCGLNLTEATARTAAMIGVFNSIDHRVPKNAGSFRRITVHLRENCVVGIPRHPASCSAATTNIADRVGNGVQRAFAELADGAGMAEVGADLSPAAGVVSGWDPRTQRRYINQIFLDGTCGAAAPHTDAWLTVGHLGAAGQCGIDAVELDELYHPILVKTRQLIRDSEGAGRHIGAPGLLVEFGPTMGEMDVAFLSEGCVHAAQGARGGLPGGAAARWLETANGGKEEVPVTGGVRLRAGDVLVSIGSGGGGYGSPLERDPSAVAESVRDGLLSKGRALEVYGVVLTTSNTVDWSATLEYRSQLDPHKRQ